MKSVLKEPVHQDQLPRKTTVLVSLKREVTLYRERFWWITEHSYCLKLLDLCKELDKKQWGIEADRSWYIKVLLAVCILLSVREKRQLVQADICESWSSGEPGREDMHNYTAVRDACPVIVTYRCDFVDLDTICLGQRATPSSLFLVKK